MMVLTMGQTSNGGKGEDVEDIRLQGRSCNALSQTLDKLVNTVCPPFLSDLRSAEDIQQPKSGLCSWTLHEPITSRWGSVRRYREHFHKGLHARPQGAFKE